MQSIPLGFTQWIRAYLSVSVLRVLVLSLQKAADLSCHGCTRHGGTCQGPSGRSPNLHRNISEVAWNLDLSLRWLCSRVGNWCL